MEPCLHVVVSYFNAPQPERAAEYDECVRRNLANPYVAGLHNLPEPGVVVPEEFRSHPKYHQEPLGRWLTYHDAFQYASRRLAGQVVCLCNLDIFLDAQGTDWRQAAEVVRREPVVFCLARHEYDRDGRVFTDPGFERLAFANTQDAWLFLAPFEVPNCDFEIGTLGCDNAIADRMRRAGRQPVNVPQRFKIFHYDRCRGKSSRNQLQVHSGERAQRGRAVSSFPEKQGYYLLPDFDAVKSVDALLNALGANEMRKYAVICDILTQFIRIDNDPRPPAAEAPPAAPPG